MRVVKGDLGGLVGAFASGSAQERWFLDTKSGHVLLISVIYQTDEEVAQTVDRIKDDPDRYLAIPFLSDEEFLEEVSLYTRLLEDRPVLQGMLVEAVKEGSSKQRIKRIFNHDPGQGKKFSEFFNDRVRERVLAWLDYQGIELSDSGGGEER